MKLNFKPDVFVEATDRLSPTNIIPSGKHYYSCFCLRSGNQDAGWDREGERARGFYEKLFSMKDFDFPHSDFDFGCMLDTMRYETSGEELQNIRFMCLYLAYLVSRDVAANKVDMMFNNT
jgi:hypothetical protein